jgi:hypothetical protein
VPLFEHSRAGVQAVADIVAIEHETAEAARMQLVID